jgi:hypothetical protein
MRSSSHGRIDKRSGTEPSKVLALHERVIQSLEWIAYLVSAFGAFEGAAVVRRGFDDHRIARPHI